MRPLGGIELPKFLSKGFYSSPEVAFQVVKIGSLILLAVPGEPTTATGRDIETLCPVGGKCLVVAPANGYMGYIVTKQEYRIDGYESDSCFFGPEAGQRVKNSLKKAIDGLR